MERERERGGIGRVSLSLSLEQKGINSSPRRRRAKSSLHVHTHIHTRIQEEKEARINPLSLSARRYMYIISHPFYPRVLSTHTRLATINARLPARISSPLSLALLLHGEINLNFFHHNLVTVHYILIITRRKNWHSFKQQIDAALRNAFPTLTSDAASNFTSLLRSYFILHFSGFLFVY